MSSSVSRTQSVKVELASPGSLLRVAFLAALLLAAGVCALDAQVAQSIAAELQRVHSLQRQLDTVGAPSAAKAGSTEPSRLEGYRPELEFLARELGKLSALADLGETATPSAVQVLVNRVERIATRIADERRSELARSSANQDDSNRVAPIVTAVGPVTGKVVDAQTLNGLSGVAIRVFDRDGVEVGSGLTNATGDYSVTPFSCTTYAGGGVPVAIGPLGTTTVTLDVPTGGIITDLNVVGLLGEHTWTGDLRFRLQSPAGTNIQFLSLSTCSWLDNFALSIDDEAPPGPVACPATDGGTYQPNAGFSLSYFDGQSSTGTWTLYVDDVVQFDGGELQAWNLEICTASDPPLPLYVRTDSELTPPYVDELFNNIDCEPSCTVTSGAPLSGIYSNVNFALSRGASISGTVTEAGTNLPLFGVTIYVYTSDGRLIRTASTNLLGVYQVLGLPNGVYYAVAVKNTATSGVSHVNQLYSGMDCAIGCDPTAGTAIITSTALPATGVNLQLMRGAVIGGTVTDESGNPLSPVSISIYDQFGGGDPLSGGALETVQANGDGQYLSERGYMPGQYRVWTSTVPNGYTRELFDNLPCEACDSQAIRHGHPVVLTTPGQVKLDVDFELSNQQGSISGQVLDGGGSALANITLQVFDWNGNLVAYAFSDLQGNFTAMNLPAGEYTVRTADYGYFVNELYDDIPCPFLLGQPTCDPANGTPIQVTSGQSTGGVVLRLATGASIRGKITDGNFIPLGSVFVTAYSPSGTMIRQALTDNVTGDYSIDGLQAGSYYLVTDNYLGFVDELYADVACPGSGSFDCGFASGTAVPVALGAIQSNVNFQLTLGGGIAGTVTNQLNGAPLYDIQIETYDSMGHLIETTFTNFAGEYNTRAYGAGLPTGSYRVVARDYFDYFVDELYDNINCPSVNWADVSCDVTTGAPVSVAQGFIQTGVNFALRQGGTIRGTLIDTTDAAVFARARAFNASGIEVASDPYAYGTYILGGLPTGSFFAEAGDWNLQAELWDDLPCPNFSCNPATGVPIQTFYALDTNQKDFILERGGFLFGFVSDSTGAGLGNASVSLYDSTGQFVMTVASRDSSWNTGYYEFQGLKPGTYFAVANAPGLSHQLYENLPCPNGICTKTIGVPLIIGEDSWVSDVDFSLQPRRLLTVTKTGGTGSGTVTSSPAGISCGSTCNASFDHGTSVTLTPAAATGSTFTGWTGACTGTGACVVSLTAAKSVNAQFSLTTGPAAVTIGLYDRTASRFYLKNQHSGGAADIGFMFGPGNSSWTPIAGDWNGDGVDTVGLFAVSPATPTNGSFFLKNQHSGGSSDIVFSYSPLGPSWLPIAGDWDGDGDDSVGLYNPATGRFYLKNQNSVGAADLTFMFGPANSGWLPIAGDWDGDGDDTVGLYNPTTGRFYLRNVHAGGAANATFMFGPANSGWLPIAGDWNGDGTTTVGLYNRSAGRFYLRNQHAGGAADVTFMFGLGNSTWFPLAGNWDGQ